MAVVVYNNNFKKLHHLGNAKTISEPYLPTEGATSSSQASLGNFNFLAFHLRIIKASNRNNSIITKMATEIATTTGAVNRKKEGKYNN